MPRDTRIQRKILFPILGCIFVLIISFAAYHIHQISHLKYNHVQAEAIQLLELNVAQIKSFFIERGRIPQTIFQDPFVVDWFKGYRTYRAPIQYDPNYRKVIGLFRNLVNSDSTIKSVYFATDNTQEYFDESGRFEDDAYYVKDRNWWHKAVSANRLYCEIGDFDYDDSTLVASLQMPVYRSENVLLGIGGIDIRVTTISQLVDKIRYAGQGIAFMLNAEGRVIALPDHASEEYHMKPLSDVQYIIPIKNMPEFEQFLISREEGFKTIVYNNQPFLALHRSIKLEKPYLKYSLVFLLPKELIDTPVARAKLQAFWSIVIISLLFTGLGVFIIHRVIRRLDKLASRLDEVANEELDLTKELPVESDDAIGQASRNFNIFVTQIRDLVSALIQSASDVANRSEQLYNSFSIISGDTQQMTTQIREVAATSRLMLENLDRVSQGVKEVARLSQQSNRVVQQGHSVINGRMQKFDEVARSILKIYDEMSLLHQQANALIDSVHVIDDVNNQISMLAINATIEAVKAGERGRGFSVVAKEIESLSENTALANKDNLKTMHNFSKSFEHFESNIRNMRDLMQDEKKASATISEMFHYLADQIERSDTAATQIDSQTKQQVEALQMIDEAIQEISQATKHLDEGVDTSSDSIKMVNLKIQALRDAARCFKVK